MKRFIINLLKWYGLALVASVVLGALCGFIAPQFSRVLSANIMGYMPWIGAIASTVRQKCAQKKEEEADETQLTTR